jgi:hypothetical protein
MCKVNNELRERSGSITSTDPLVSFLYELLRDHLPAADVEHLVRNASSEPTTYSNGYLANYAIDLATRLREAKKKVTINLNF